MVGLRGSFPIDVSRRRGIVAWKMYCNALVARGARGVHSVVI